MAEFAVVTGDQAFYRSEDIQLGEGAPHTSRHAVRRLGLGWRRYTLGEWGSPRSLPDPDYKNNILKERAELAHSPLPAKNIDLDKGEWLPGR